MLFSSWPFVAAFLPVVFAVYALLMRYGGRRRALYWLVAASLFFYGWFEWAYLLIISTSIVFNYLVGTMLAASQAPARRRKALLAFGVAANLGALFYYKYTGLFFKTLNDLGGDYALPDILLPIGISFFTFQSIAWLVDSYRRETVKTPFMNFAFFITFFPQLIAGPIVHHREMLPQIGRGGPNPAQRQRLLAAGLTAFFIGLFKKVGIADYMGEIADPIFASAAAGADLTVIEAWLGPLAYTLQIYFDFSGYSDMAVGLAAMFGIRLPLNFFSPYKAADIIEFWRRWHITLSCFLRDYVYIPLGGNRKGPGRRHINLMVTMLLGGLWHGASWTFAVWGGLHGLYLVVAHSWKRFSPYRLPRPVAIAITFLSVMVAWVFFRADSFDSAVRILHAMTGAHGLALQNTGGWLADIARWFGFDVQSVGYSRNLRIHEKWYLLWAVLAAVFLMPSTHEIMRRRLAVDITGVSQGVRSVFRLVWRPRLGWAVTIGLIAGISMAMMTRVNAFIYFQF